MKLEKRLLLIALFLGGGGSREQAQREKENLKP